VLKKWFEEDGARVAREEEEWRREELERNGREDGEFGCWN